MSKKKTFYGGRSMLNSVGHHSTASVVAEIEDTSRHGAERDARGKKITASYLESVYPTVRISDCDRAVALDFSVEPEHFENDLAKLDTMIEILAEFREGFIAEGELHKAREKHVKKVRKEAKKK
jgi:hypothetical protein